MVLQGVNWYSIAFGEAISDVITKLEEILAKLTQREWQAVTYAYNNVTIRMRKGMNESYREMKEFLVPLPDLLVMYYGD